MRLTRGSVGSHYLYVVVMIEYKMIIHAQMNTTELFRAFR